MREWTRKFRKATWRAIHGTRTNAGMKGRRQDNRATKRAKRAGRGNP